MPIAKSASTSIQSWIYQLDQLSYDTRLGNKSERTISIPQKEFDERFQDYFLFTSVRNPFSRLVSCYIDKFILAIFNNGIRQKRKYADIPAYQRNINNFNQLEQFAIDNLGATVEKGMTFEMFLQAIETNLFSNLSKERVDGHWALQYDKGNFRNVSYNFVCRAESLLADIKSVQKILNIPDSLTFDLFKNQKRGLDKLESNDYFGNIPASQLSKSKLFTKVPDKNFYSQATIKIVEQKCQQDLEYFKYQNLGYL